MQKTSATLNAAKLMILTGLILSGCNDASPIIITPADALTVQALDTLGNPIVGADIGYYKINFKLDTPSTTPPTPYTTPGAFEEAASMQTTDAQGMSTFFLPRHGDVNTHDVMVVKQPWGNLYSFVLTRNIKVDMVSTVFYEMIAYSTVSPSDFTVKTLLALQTQAQASIDKAIANHWINPSTSLDKLHRAYQNALASDSVFMLALINKALALTPPTSLFGYVPYSNFNTGPKLAGFIPSQITPFVVETNTLDLQVSGSDKDKDTVFYSWVSSTTPLTSSTLSQGTLLKSEVLANSTSKLAYASSYDTNQWYESLATVYVYAVISDGSTPLIQQWSVSLSNKERVPVFTTTGPTAGAEEQLWTYTPAATSPDGAPMRLSLVAPTPANVDMCVPDKFYMTNPPQGKEPLAIPQVWTWQVAATPCTTPYEITWTPNNCQSGPVYSPVAVVISAIDETGASTIQTVQVTVTDINNAPTITSAPAGLTIAGPVTWTYTPAYTDPQSAAGPTGATSCGDTFAYSLTKNPPGTTINATTGAVTWSPLGTDVGNNDFTINLTDSHGGITTQDWTVVVDNMNDTPTISAASCSPTAHMAGPDMGLPPSKYICLVSVSQWTVGSLFQATITGMPGTVSQVFGGNPSAWLPSTTSFGFRWTPTDADVLAKPADKTFPIGITICNDGAGGLFAPACSTYNYTLTAPREDIKPTFTTFPPVTVMGGCLAGDCAVIGASTYSYAATVQDLNSVTAPVDTFGYSLTQPSPAGSSAMTLTPGSTTAPTGTLTLNWPVNNSTDLGIHTVTLNATSGIAANGGPQTATQSWSIYVQETNRIPYFDAVAPQTGQNGQLYTMNYKNICHTNATTSPNKNLTFGLAPGFPTGMTINSTTGILNWTPTSAQAKGPQPMNYTVQCISKFGTPTATQTLNVPVNLNWVNLPPQWVTIPDQIIGVNQNFSTPIQATDPDGDAVTLSQIGLPAGAMFGSSGADGLLAWTPSIGDVGNHTINFTASDGSLTTPMAVNIQVVNSPVVLSNPVIRATATNPYHYEIHALDPVGMGLTFTMNSSSPTGVEVNAIPGYTDAAMVTWTPGLAFGGDQVVTVEIRDGDNNLVMHDWHINVGTGPENLPIISAVTPSGSPVIATEGSSQTYSVTATDPDGDALHYAYYWDDKWIADGVTSFVYTPLDTEAGDHTMTIAVTDGAGPDVLSIMNVHVRDALPKMGQIYQGPVALTGIMANSRSGELYAWHGGGSPALEVFSETGFFGGPVSSHPLPFSPQRVVLKNSFPIATDYVLFFAQLGDLMAGANSFAQLDSTGLLNTCVAGVCFNSTFLQNPQSVGGTHSTYVTGSTTAYYIKSSDRRYIGTYVNGVAGADIDLGVGASGNALAYDSVTSKIFVSAGGINRVTVISTASNTVTAQISGVGTNPSTLALNSVSGKIYVYSPSDGSISEILTATNANLGSRLGFPTSASIGADPTPYMIENTGDDVIYLALPDTHQLVVYDIINSAIRTMNLPDGPDELAFDTNTQRIFGASYSAGKIYQFR